MAKVNLINEITDLEHRANRVLRRHSPDAWLDLNLTTAQLKSMFFINHEGSTNVTNLANALEVTPANVTGIVDRLVEQGMISRTENPEDRRALILRVTEKGKQILDSLRERRIKQMSEVLTRLSPEELSILAHGLRLLVRAAETYERENYGNQATSVDD